jgi:hypothetical protein
MLFLVVSFTLSAAGLALSQDNIEKMYLHGIIKKIDLRGSRVDVNLLNKGCKGEKTFKIENASRFNYLPGEKISFFIDGGRCPGFIETRTMIGPRRER